MNGRAAAAQSGVGASARDVVVTGMGFCLPSDGRPVFTAAEVWDIASHGRSCLLRDGVYHGPVNLTNEMFEERLPDLPGVFSRTSLPHIDSVWCHWQRRAWTPS